MKKYTFADGLEARLRRIEFRDTYQDLWFGAPTAYANAQIIENAVKMANQWGLANSVSAILMAPEMPNRRFTATTNAPMLPAIQCVCYFDASPIADGYDISELVTVSFQDTAELPKDDIFKTITWATVATDVCCF